METLRSLVRRQGKASGSHATSDERTYLNPMCPLFVGDNPIPPVHIVTQALQTIKEDLHSEHAGLHKFLAVESFTESVRKVFLLRGGYNLADFIIANGGLIDVFLKGSILQKENQMCREMQQCMKACQANLETALSRLPPHMQSTMEYIVALLFGSISTGNESAPEAQKPAQFISGEVFVLCTLTLILKALPPSEDSRSRFASECIDTARAALDKHQKFCEAIQSDDDRHVDICFNWTILHNPFIPFIVIFCHVIESTDDTTDDLGRLEMFVKTLETARLHSGATSNTHRHFEVLYQVALQYKGKDQLSNTGFQFEAYGQFIEHISDPMSHDETSMLLPGMPFGDQSTGEWQGSQVAGDWFQTNQEGWGPGEGSQYSSSFHSTHPSF
ncbi:hypothetical protein QQX98_012178 [Neonectria punicea]|uniref:Uncharacterized protein n=1 Tax=Neonectria punicea TaxID=979145 RepID=A0ABR1GJI6_9HYPO